MLSLGFHIAMGTGSSNRTQRLPGTESLVFPILSDQNVTEEHRRRRRLQAMEGGLEGNTMPLGYFYTRLHVGTPGQVFTVIVDTGSSLLAFPCEGCQRCGTHMDSYFRPLDSTTFKPGSCKNIKDCQACDKGRCMYRTHFVEGSSISGFIASDQIGALPSGASVPEFTSEALFGCQQTETGLFKAQLADGIMGMGHGHYPTLLQSLVANERKKNTLTFCVTRSGGYIKLGANPTTGPTTFITPMMGNKKYYIIKILDMQVGSTNLQVNPSVFNSGQGVLIDSGTSLIYLPRSAANRYREVFAKETSHMNLGRAERIDGADCWRVQKAPPEGIKAFPQMHIRFEGTGLIAFHPIHYMFNHPQVEDPTHYCYGILDNGATGTVLGSLFMRHLLMTIDKDARKVHMQPNECGDSLHTLSDFPQ